MITDLFSKLESGQPFCYLNLNEKDLSLWNFLVQAPNVTNTHFLFRAAARPHFDYFFELTDFLGLKDRGDLNIIEDQKFKDAVCAKQDAFINHDEVIRGLEVFMAKQKPQVTIITNNKNPIKVKAIHKVIIKDRELFGNVEPVWNQIKKQLPRQTDVFLMNLNEEKFLIGPRLKLKFNKPVLDVCGADESVAVTKSKFKNIIKNLFYE